MQGVLAIAKCAKENNIEDISTPEIIQLADVKTSRDTHKLLCEFLIIKSKYYFVRRFIIRN